MTYDPYDPYGPTQDPYAQPAASYDDTAATVYAPPASYAPQTPYNPYPSAPTGYAEPSSAETSGYASNPSYAPFYAPAPYGGEQAGYANPFGSAPYLGTEEHPRSATVLALGIVGVVVLRICGPIAWIMGSRARREIREHPERFSSSGSLTAGWIMGIIGTALLAIEVLMIFFVIVVELAGYH